MHPAQPRFARPAGLHNNLRITEHLTKIQNKNLVPSLRYKLYIQYSHYCLDFLRLSALLNIFLQKKFNFHESHVTCLLLQHNQYNNSCSFLQPTSPYISNLFAIMEVRCYESSICINYVWYKLWPVGYITHQNFQFNPFQQLKLGTTVSLQLFVCVILTKLKADPESWCN